MTATPSNKRVIILGAASAVAEATARLYAAEGAVLLLVGRRADRLEAMASDLKLRGASRIEIAVCDLAACPATEVSAQFSSFVTQLGGLDHVLIAYGVLGDQRAAEQNAKTAEDVIQTNFTSTALWILEAANRLEQQGYGALIVLGSVAGDRGRRSNYVYGATKAALATLVQGIAHRFGPHGPRAVIVKPGPIDTPMTAGMTKGGPMWATADAVAKIVRRSADQGGVVVYAPARWRLIMLIIRTLPGAVFNRTKL
jgi:NAD(P)-dependent dehydrogenase (short-subunit alcohol dehydrogenase family)